MGYRLTRETFEKSYESLFSPLFQMGSEKCLEIIRSIQFEFLEFIENDESVEEKFQIFHK